MVNWPIIARKVGLTAEHLRRIQSLPARTLEEFKKDALVQDVLLFNLTQAIQNCVDIAAHVVSDEGWGVPETQSEAFEILKGRGVISVELSGRLVGMVGFRNRVIHEYEQLNWEIVHDIWLNRIGDIEEFCRIVAERFGR